MAEETTKEELKNEEDVKEEKGTRKTPPTPTVSPEALLTASFTGTYSYSLSSGKEYAFEKMLRMTKIFCLFANVLGLIALFFFFSSYFHWFALGLPTDIFQWSNLFSFGLAVAFDLTLLIGTLVRFFSRSKDAHKGKEKKEEVYFLKDFFVVIGLKDQKKEQKVFSYSQVKRLIETKHYFFIQMVNGEEAAIYKPSLLIKKHLDLDSMRGRIESLTKKNFYISSYVFNPRYEFYFDQDNKFSKNLDNNKIILIFAFLTVFPPLFINFRDGLSMDYVWLFWVSGIIEVLLLILTCVLKYEKETPHRLFRLSLLISSLGLVLTMIVGISGSVYNTYTRFEDKVKEFKAESSITLPTSSLLDEANTFAGREVIFNTYCSQTSGVFKDEEEISSFETALDSSPYWLETASLAKKESTLQLLPYYSHFNAKDGGYYYTMYSSSKKVFFPEISTYGVNSIDDVSESKMWYACYNPDKNEMYIVEYNIVQGMIYPIPNRY